MPLSHRVAVELIDVSVELPGVPILNHVNWRLPMGTVAAILGPNGSGKSTLLRAITAYGHITRGSVRVLGEELGKVEVHSLRQKLGIVDPKLYRLLDRGVTAEQLVATGLYGHLTTFFDRPTAAQLAVRAAGAGRSGAR